MSNLKGYQKCIMWFTTIALKKNYYFKMPMYRIINEKSTHTTFIWLRIINQSKMCACSHNSLLQTRTITHTKTLSHRTICQDIWFSSRQTILYKQSRSQTIPKNVFAPFCHPQKKLLSETKLSHSSLLHPHALHTSISTSKCDSKI